MKLTIVASPDRIDSVKNLKDSLSCLTPGLDSSLSRLGMAHPDISTHRAAITFAEQSN